MNNFFMSVNYVPKTVEDPRDSGSNLSHSIGAVPENSILPKSSLPFPFKVPQACGKLVWVLQAEIMKGSLSLFSCLFLSSLPSLVVGFTPGDGYIIAVFAIVSSVCCALMMVRVLYRIRVNRVKAEEYGDVRAASKIFLPCYKPMFWAFLVLYILVSVVLVVLDYVDGDPSRRTLVFIFYFYTQSAIINLPPVLLMQPGVSHLAFFRTFIVVAGWYVVCTGYFLGVTAFSHLATFDEELAFLLMSTLPSVILNTALLRGWLPSRVRNLSSANKCSRLCIVDSIFIAIFFLNYWFYFKGEVEKTPDERRDDSATKLWASIGFLFVMACCFTVSPWVIYRTLLADTRYWRGVGWQNEGGLEKGKHSTPLASVDVLANDFQFVVTNLKDLIVDFAFLKVGVLLGDGTTSRVYRARVAQSEQKCAIKVHTSAEVTEETIKSFVNEVALMRRLEHINIVRFFGVCIRPPQLGAIVELCERGNLKESLNRDKENWCIARRLCGVLGAARAIAYIHSQSPPIVHRDVKTENFFVTYDYVVKLGDFGESSLDLHRAYRFRSLGQEVKAGLRLTHEQDILDIDEIRNEKNSAQSLRGTHRWKSTNNGDTYNMHEDVIGSVQYMAPELVNRTGKYGVSVDIYALAIVFWEIWSGCDPYEGFNMFEIFEKVRHGQRLQIPDDMPPFLYVMIKNMWSQAVEDRPNAQSVLNALLTQIPEYLNKKNLRTNFHEKLIATELDTVVPLRVAGLRSISVGTSVMMATMFESVSESVSSFVRSLTLRGAKEVGGEGVEGGQEGEDLESSTSSQNASDRRSSSNPLHDPASDDRDSTAYFQTVSDSDSSVRRDSAVGRDSADRRNCALRRDSTIDRPSSNPLHDPTSDPHGRNTETAETIIEQL
jgi:serine/threonine protein kinase